MQSLIVATAQSLNRRRQQFRGVGQLKLQRPALTLHRLKGEEVEWKSSSGHSRPRDSAAT